jgi:predicted transcriptional regulator
MTITSITDTNYNALRVLIRLVDTHGAVSLEEWAQALDLSYGSVIQHKRALLRHDLVEDTKGRSRSTRPSALGRSYVHKQKG